ncbi:ROK family protein [Pontibacter akesuensis]|uniref:Glucokinase n=1 Tax=Pontibacter akesuensis TaxID=388950 RepID=A0A1I7FI65_9BACT|nr:ROK family protein [Pontibacter akesuensis]GHA62061.1 hypothetical protein GCM10007389_13380 [Pontibacter akesuensis]SFU35877.1 glucokinase [Pontibacter akesuensis]
MPEFVLGVDIGGTHITAAVIDLSSRAILQETLSRAPVDSGGSVQQVITTWSSAMHAAIRKSGQQVRRMGIAMPGPFDYEYGVALMQNQGKYDHLYGVNVRPLLAQELQVPEENILFQNDAPCFLQGEFFGGAAKGCTRAIGMTLGTGLGSTWYANGKAVDADRWNTPFGDSIAEEYLSSRWFVKRFEELTGQQVPNVKAIVDQFPTEPKVQQLFDEFGKNLGVFLIPFAQERNPEVIVLGGNIAKALPLFAPLLLQTLHQQNVHVPVKQAQLGEEAALIGAASLWKQA